MASGRNRITELESTVEELQATVRGLTEELVEANERIRLLEQHVEGEPTKTAEPTQEPATEAEEAKSQGSEDRSKESDESGLGDDIIVA